MTPHPDLTALVAGIRHDPNTALRRLVVADWFEERGEPERAEYIRLAVAATGELRECREQAGGKPPRPGCACEACAGARRLRDLADVYLPKWEHELCEPGRAMWAKRHRDPPADYRPRFRWALGFVVAAKCRLDWWLEWGPLVSRLHPVRKIEVRDLNPLVETPPPERGRPRVARYHWGPPAGRSVTSTEYGDGHLPAVLWHSRHIVQWTDADPNRSDSRPGLASKRWPSRRVAMDALSEAGVEWAALVEFTSETPG